MMVRAAVVLILLALLPAVAHAQKRVALVIGNSAYQRGPPATNQVPGYWSADELCGWDVPQKKSAGTGGLSAKCKQGESPTVGRYRVSGTAIR
jgi:hypothetical protein